MWSLVVHLRIAEDAHLSTSFRDSSVFASQPMMKNGHGISLMFTLGKRRRASFTKRL